MVKIKINKNKSKPKAVKRKVVLKKRRDVLEVTNDSVFDSDDVDEEDEQLFRIHRKTKVHIKEKPHVDIDVKTILRATKMIIIFMKD